jgi:hypothetical protein
MPHFMEKGGQQIVASDGGGAGGAVGGVGEGLVEFAVFPRGRVNEPAEAVEVEQEGIGVEGAGGGEASELGYG